MRAVHRLEHEAVDDLFIRQDSIRCDDFPSSSFINAIRKPLTNSVETLHDFSTSTTGLCAFLEVIVLDNGSELAVFVVRKMPAGFVKCELSNMGREDLTVALLSQFFADEILQFLANDSSVGRPQNETLANIIVDVKKLELFPKLAVIAFLGFLKCHKVLLQFFRSRERGTIKSLELAFGFVPHVE